MDYLGFLQLLAALIAKYDPDQFDPSLKPPDSAGCSSRRNDIYDFVIVGAGSAGCTLANRLSENPKWKVLLIEAGRDESFVTDTPALQIASLTYGSPYNYNWNYRTVPQANACKLRRGTCFYPRGLVMGGSSSVNAMIYDRGCPQDFDEWEAMGNPGWSYKNVLPYFIKSENMTIKEFANSPYSGTKGPLTVGYSVQMPSITDDLVLAGKQYGLNEVDYNTRDFIGTNFVQKTVRGPSRCSASKAYLNPIRNRENLVVFKNTEVMKVLVNNITKRAYGVRCTTNSSRPFDILVRKEVILSAGSINTPKILILSGIGPADHLKELNIPKVLDLPVGIGLRDHPLIFLNLKLNPELIKYENPYTAETALEYAKYKTGPLTTNGLDALIQINRDFSSAYPPDALIPMGMGNYSLSSITTEPYLTIAVGIVNSKSRGTVKVANSDYKTPPLIDPNYYGNPEDLDLALWTVKEVFKYLNTPALKKYSPTWRPEELPPPCQNLTYLSDEQLKCYINFVTQTYFHPVGTAKMGPASDPSTVVNHELKVHGAKGLRVIDASIVPNMPRGTTNPITIMIAEKASETIKENYGFLRKFPLDFLKVSFKDFLF